MKSLEPPLVLEMGAVLLSTMICSEVVSKLTTRVEEFKFRKRMWNLRSKSLSEKTFSVNQLETKIYHKTNFVDKVDHSGPLP